MDKSDRHHEASWKIFPELIVRYEGLVVSNHVLGESYTLIRCALGHEAAWKFMNLVRQNAKVEKLFTPENLEQEAYAVLKKYADQDFSFVDAVSFVWMQALKIRDAFSFDKHFSIFGFVRIPEF